MRLDRRLPASHSEAKKAESSDGRRLGTGEFETGALERLINALRAVGYLLGEAEPVATTGRPACL